MQMTKFFDPWFIHVLKAAALSSIAAGNATFRLTTYHSSDFADNPSDLESTQMAG
jgi:hypothetical protein